MKPWEIVQQEFSCDHLEQVICKKVNRDKREAFFSQCVRCGQGFPCKKESAYLKYGCKPVPLFDQSLLDSWISRRNSRMLELSANDREKENQEWWALYERYLDSVEWKERREKVLNRDKRICQACLSAVASQVHHLTYERVFNEPLFDLISVCVECHELITEISRNKNKG